MRSVDTLTLSRLMAKMKRLGIALSPPHPCLCYTNLFNQLLAEKPPELTDELTLRITRSKISRQTGSS